MGRMQQGNDIFNNNIDVWIYLVCVCACIYHTYDNIGYKFWVYRWENSPPKRHQNGMNG